LRLDSENEKILAIESPNIINYQKKDSKEYFRKFV
jgi:hypothetical protein